jgi:hypothetical protein
MAPNKGVFKENARGVRRSGEGFAGQEDGFRASLVSSGNARF